MKKILILLVALILVGCKNEPTPSTKVSGFSFINGKVVEKFGPKVIVQIEEKEIFHGNDFESRISNKIINSSLFVNGISTYIGDSKATIEDIRSLQVTADLGKNNLQSDDEVKIFIPKKTIAIVDFESLSEGSDNIAKPVQENLTTKFVQSGQYVVVERSKISAILEEQKLKEINDDKAGEIGKLVSADLVLTGTFAKKGSNWVVNLRMIDVSTGVIRSAVKENVNAKEFRSSIEKESTDMYIGFDDGKFADGWAKGLKRTHTKADIDIDDSTGANNTKSSIKINFKFKGGDSSVAFFNGKQRDAGRYKGIEFYAKSSENILGRVVIHDTNYDNTNVNRYVASFGSGKEWKKIQIPFTNFMLGRKFAKKNPGGDGVLDLDMINSIAIAFRGQDNTLNEKTVWLDEIKLY